MRESVVLVYSTDPWHHRDSRRLIGVAADVDAAVDIVRRELDARGCVLDGETELQLRGMMQTQTSGDEFDGEFLLEVHSVACGTSHN